ncbi:MAG: P1 family peptidase [Acidobacteria bacterium]|nr:P1 family peptidase [Acidobacteriota bacterium]
MRKAIAIIVLFVATAVGLLSAQEQKPEARVRVRELGIKPGLYEPGPNNAITDVPGVRVGQVTIREDLPGGKAVRTGVTAILPHSGNLFREKVAGAVYVFNAFGKLVGSTQVNELGQIETPILLTNTLSVWDAAAAMTDWMLALPGNENVRSMNPVVGETNDGGLNDIRGRHVKAEHVRRALESAKEGPVEEGTVGAGTGTVAFGWKGGIGTSSRKIPAAKEAGYTVGAVVQTNFGGRLTIDGVPVWREMQPPLARAGADAATAPTADGSCIIVVATDAPLDARQLKRLAARAIHGMARAGSTGSHGSGDFVIAFSTTNRYVMGQKENAPIALVREDDLSPLFQAVIEATEEAIYNSLLRATTVKGEGGRTVEAVPIEKLREVLKKHGRGM